MRDMTGVLRSLVGDMEGSAQDGREGTDADTWDTLHKCVSEAVTAVAPAQLERVSRDLRARAEEVASGAGERGQRRGRALAVESLRAAAQLIDGKATMLMRAPGGGSWKEMRCARAGEEPAEDGEGDEDMGRQRDLERAARMQLSAFVRDISLVQDVSFLRSRLATLQVRVGSNHNACAKCTSIAGEHVTCCTCSQSGVGAATADDSVFRPKWPPKKPCRPSWARARRATDGNSMRVRRPRKLCLRA